MRNGPTLTHSELALEFSEIFRELEGDELEEVIEKNVPVETLEFFRSYANCSDSLPLSEIARDKAPNLMLMGYLLRVLEERLLAPQSFDA